MSSRPGERMIHQDFIARIRYSNALPPPPNPPKLLDIPNTGLSSGQYTNPSFASRLAREQPLNIEADAELGMPLDLVGMPGVFDGDERCEALLRPLTALGKRKVAEANVSFLRRTEYISSLTSKRFESSNPRAMLTGVRKPARRSPERAADSPQVIKRKIDRSFELAGEELDERNRKRVRHPSRKDLELVEATPLLPDLEAFPDSGAFVTIKFGVNPVPKSGEYDRRLLTSLFKPIDRTEAEDAAYDAALEAHTRDPERFPRPQNLMNYDFFLPSSKATGTNFRRMFDVEDDQREDPTLYTHESGSGGCFQFNRVRGYETTQETELDHTTKYSNEVLLAQNDGGSRQKAVYYYPVLQKSTIRPQRMKNIARTIGFPGDDEEKVVERMDVTVEDPNEEMLDAMKKYSEHPLGWEGDEEEHEHDNDDEDKHLRGNSEEPREASPEESKDAEGEDEDED
ncbi:hypothetical protein GMORB2_2235 [Geosmithia morbida]|uniref:Uncharacterized protein n=1 Tax=Geosmithia morbida TaxID=1094350 RepID=A0A9P4YT74_9HYPO|nr:uncharacterized protein GMORB2_2235 [Geosmithia morbida]KAF4121273.1 hypothetical protein GMORB2_2235 [Geosmithia morbida]